jgi:type VI protein secretion system component VasF
MTKPDKTYGKYFRLGKKYSLKEDLKIILQKAVTHEQELGDLKDVFYFVEGKTFQSPTLTQWQQVNEAVVEQIRSQKPSAVSFLRRGRDWWLTTDSRWKTFIAYVVCALVALIVLVCSYVAYRLLFGQTASAVAASLLPANPTCALRLFPKRFIKMWKRHEAKC